jgi:hypothetical protein
MKLEEAVKALRAAKRRGIKIDIMNCLADLWGAVRVEALPYKLKMRDLHAMNKYERTRRKNRVH